MHPFKSIVIMKRPWMTREGKPPSCLAQRATKRTTQSSSMVQAVQSLSLNGWNLWLLIKMGTIREWLLSSITFKDITKCYCCNIATQTINKQNHNVYEFHGCLWQGCPCCHPHHPKLHEPSQNTVFCVSTDTTSNHVWMWLGCEVKSSEDLKQSLAS